MNHDSLSSKSILHPTYWLSLILLMCSISLPSYAAQNLGAEQWKNDQQRYDDALKKLPATANTQNNVQDHKATSTALSSDKTKYYFPEQNQSSTAKSTSNTKKNTGKTVNINTASAEELSAALTGVGLKKAQAIIDYRKQHGDFKSADELSNVKGIGAKTLEKNKSHITLH